MDNKFEAIVNDALVSEITGWDFSLLADRWQENDPTWDYRQIVIDHLPKANSLLDMGTGGGEFLSALPNLPQLTKATESYAPNIPIARKRLEPLGISVFTFEDDDHLPFEDQAFDLIINRHESFSATELYRLLKPGGRFLTQQVGGQDNIEINQALQDKVDMTYAHWHLDSARQPLEQAGFQIVEAWEEFPETRFQDIGAIIIYLKAAPWQIEGFDVDLYRDQLFALHQRINTEGFFATTTHRFYLECIRTA
ncbi:MAG: methyltransferase domain-containing protein [Chloroflexota bacterium]